MTSANDPSNGIFHLSGTIRTKDAESCTLSVPRHRSPARCRSGGDPKERLHLAQTLERRKRAGFFVKTRIILERVESSCESMKALLLKAVGQPLALERVPRPRAGDRELLLRVRACAVCRTDLHVIDGDLAEPRLPLILGHEIVGEVVARGPEAERFDLGDRVGVPWLGGCCKHCTFCRSGRENLCDHPIFTGYGKNGGFAEYAAADQDFCFAIPPKFSDTTAAPLLCAGLIGYRALRMAGDAERLGIYGFGAAAHLICQLAVHQGRKVFAMTREGDEAGQEFARTLGAIWAGGSESEPPEELDAALIFAPVGSLVPRALSFLARGGTVVCAGIHMSEIPSFPYEALWGERAIRSVANLTRRDGEDFLALASEARLDVHTESFPLEEGNEVVARLRRGAIRGAAVLHPGSLS